MRVSSDSDTLASVVQILSSLPVRLYSLTFRTRPSVSTEAYIRMAFGADERVADLVQRKLMRLIGVLTIKLTESPRGRTADDSG